ncbi:hypothetical protein LXA47_00435 [Massilia sp. P8910]|uniref:hypothetical protein n=1 Tax=Massilia antarctica TaxID=2765360 RepID=UPI001E605676|nr:hypothetical protein [Massilia antarctica]MCE3602078.1 hypothetical protein [Massilia antarctica]
MEEVFDKETWTRFVSGYTIFDCAIIREKGFGFILVEERDSRDPLPKTRFINMAIDQPIENRFAVSESEDFTFTSIAASMTPPEYVSVDTRSQVYSASGQRKGQETAIDDLIDMSTVGARVGIVTKVVRAAGQIYAIGDYRKIYRRLGVDQWIELGNEGKGVPLPADVATSGALPSTFGFSDMSAFDTNDMYAVGGKGDVWRFDGSKWHNCPIPTNAKLKTVCCAGDGVVYLTEANGSVWAGRTDNWKLIAEADIAPGYQPVDAVWFNNRLYLGGQEGIWTIDVKKKLVVPLQEVEPDAPNPTNGGRLDISPDGKFLLTAGPHGACLHDGSGWRRLFSAFDYL